MIPVRDICAEDPKIKAILEPLSDDECQALQFALMKRLDQYLGGWGVSDLTENFPRYRGTSS